MRFTMVIPNYNSGHVLERAILSIRRQNLADVQLIMADGGSTDMSREVLGRYASDFDPLIERRDAGQADALNHAFRHARGDIHAWLAADDELLPGALDHVAAIFESHPEVDVVAGASERVFEGHFRNFVPVELNAWDVLPAQNPFDQPSVFWRAALHRRIGELDTSFELAFDWDYWCRMHQAGARLHITQRALSRYYFSAHNKSSLAGGEHIAEQFRVVRRHGPRMGLLAYAFRHLYRSFDLEGCMDEPPSCTPEKLRSFQRRKALLEFALGKKWIGLYNWHFASLQQRKLEWWDYKRPSLEELKSRLPMTETAEATDCLVDECDAALTDGDLHLPHSLDTCNLVLNRRRLSEFLAAFGRDADARDLLLLDALCALTGVASPGPFAGPRSNVLALQPHRLWQYVWLFKGLGLRAGGRRVLSAGGYFSLIDLLAAAAGNEVVCVGLDEHAVAACEALVEKLGIQGIQAPRGGLESWKPIADGFFDCAISVALLHRLPADGQSLALARMARAVKPQGVIGLSFDYGPAERYTSLDRPYQHHPPSSAAEIRKLAGAARLAIAGGGIEEPAPGGLSPASGSHVLAALFLTKGETAVCAPRAVDQAPSLPGNLSIPELARTVYRTAAAGKLRRDREEAEKQNWVTLFNELNGRVATAESAAQSRLEALEQVHRDAASARAATEGLAAECEMLRAEAEKRLALINKLSASRVRRSWKAVADRLAAKRGGDG